jgi:hypothetical protein
VVAEKLEAEKTFEPSTDQVQSPPSVTIPAGQQLTRRQMRELGGNAPVVPSSTVEAKTAAASERQQEPAGPAAPARPGSRRALRDQAPTPVEAPDIDVPEPEFTGQNLLAEPSTAAIVLEKAPEAIELPIETGELTVTGSIQVVTGPITGPSTSTLDSVALDDELDDDAVTGVLSTTAPVSALELIGERSATGVVPRSTLRKGWWRPLVYAIAAIALALASIWATMTILGAIGR